MPLHVHCPNGCVIRMSSNRAGRIVRCPKCKSAIRIPPVMLEDLQSGQPIPVQARIAQPKLEVQNQPATQTEAAPEQLDASENPPALVQQQGAPNLEQTDDVVAKTDLVTNQPTEELPSDTASRMVRLPVPELIKPSLRRRVTPVVSDPEASPETSLDDSNETMGSATDTAFSSMHGDDPVAEQPLTGTAAENYHSNEDVEEPVDESLLAEEESWVDKSVLELLESKRALADSKKTLAEQAASIEGVDSEQDPGSIGVVDPTTEVPTAEESSQVQEFSLNEINEFPVESQPEVSAGQAITDEVESSNDVNRVPDVTAEVEPTATATDLDEIVVVGESVPAAPSRDDSFDEVPFLKPIASGQIGSYEAIRKINLTDPIEETAIAPEETNWEERLEKANSDRRILARFFAICLCLVAIVNMAPALYHWYHWTQLEEAMALPRWIYIQLFVGAIHLVYAVFLFQIGDWSAMRAVSVAMLVVAFVFGFISTGLLVGGGEGNLTGFLGIPYMLNRQACIWCVAMLCLATLMSYWGGKESSNWQRTDDLLKDILAKS